MPIHLMRRAFRERRRVALLVVSVYAALRLAGPAWAAQPLVAAALAVGLGAAFGTFSVFAPRYRSLAETAALACLAFAALVRAHPASGLDGGLAALHPLPALGIWVGLLAVAAGLYRAFETLPLPRLLRPRFKARAGSRIDIYRLWSAIGPDSCAHTQSGGPGIASVEDRSLRPGTVRPRAGAGPEPRTAPEWQILEVEAPFRVRLRTGACDGAEDVAGVSEIFLVELGPQRLVLFAHEFPEMPLGRALLAWLDDLPGRMLDRRLAAVERGARGGALSPAQPEPGSAGTTAPEKPGAASANQRAAVHPDDAHSNDTAPGAVPDRRSRSGRVSPDPPGPGRAGQAGRERPAPA